MKNMMMMMMMMIVTMMVMSTTSKSETKLAVCLRWRKRTRSLEHWRW